MAFFAPSSRSERSVVRTFARGNRNARGLAKPEATLRFPVSSVWQDQQTRARVLAPGAAFSDAACVASGLHVERDS